MITLLHPCSIWLLASVIYQHYCTTEKQQINIFFNNKVEIDCYCQSFCLNLCWKTVRRSTFVIPNIGSKFDWRNAPFIHPCVHLHKFLIPISNCVNLIEGKYHTGCFWSCKDTIEQECYKIWQISTVLCLSWCHCNIRYVVIYLITKGR